MCNQTSNRKLVYVLSFSLNQKNFDRSLQSATKWEGICSSETMTRRARLFVLNISKNESQLAVNVPLPKPMKFRSTQQVLHWAFNFECIFVHELF